MDCRALNKCALIMFNCSLLLTGILMLSSGIWLDYEMGSVVKPGWYYNKMSKAIFGLGCWNIFISSWGFNCIKKEKPILLFLYVGFLLCQFMIQVGLATAWFHSGAAFGSEVYQTLRNIIADNDHEISSIRILQSQLYCCGANNFTDWTTLSPQRVIPQSCCIDPFDCVTANYNDVYQKGCFEVLYRNYVDNLVSYLIIFIMVTIHPAIGVLITMAYTFQVSREASKLNKPNRDHYKPVLTHFVNI